MELVLDNDRDVGHLPRLDDDALVAEERDLGRRWDPPCGIVVNDRGQRPHPARADRHIGNHEGPITQIAARVRWWRRSSREEALRRDLTGDESSRDVIGPIGKLTRCGKALQRIWARREGAAREHDWRVGRCRHDVASDRPDWAGEWDENPVPCELR